jgi:hypothetical protein
MSPTRRPRPQLQPAPDPGATGPAPAPQRPSATGLRIVVERVETEPLSADQRRDAVTALAVLIDRWLGHTTQPPDRADLPGCEVV